MLFWRRLVLSRLLLTNRSVRWLVVSRFLIDFYFYSTTIVLFQSQRGLNFTEMFLMETIISGTIWISDIPTSVLADRIGYRQLIIAGRVLTVVGMVLFFFAHGFWMFAFSNMLSGISIACISSSESALVYGSLPLEQRNEQGKIVFSLLSMATSAGLFLGLLIGSFLGAISPTLAVGVSIIPSACALLAALRLPSTPLPATEQHKEVVSTYRKILLIAIKTVIAQPGLACLGMFRALAFAITNAIFWYNQSYFSRAGIPVMWFGPLMAVAMGGQIILLWQLPNLQRRWGFSLLLAFTCLLPGLAYILLAPVSEAVIVVLLVACIVAVSGCLQPLIENELNRAIPDQSRATTLSALSLIGSFAGMLCNPLIGYVGDQGLGMTGLVLGASLIVLCGVIPLMAKVMHLRKESSCH